MPKNDHTSNALVKILKDRTRIGNVLVCRGAAELEYLVSVLNPLKEQTKSVVVRDTESDAALSVCKICPDVIERKPPFGSGVNRVMIILNAPGMASRAEIGIFRGESVSLLKKMVAAIGLELRECYVTNLIKCESSNPLVKPSDMVKNCLGVLQGEIDRVKPVIVMVMGDILPLQGIVNSSRGIAWFNTEHTISLVRNPDLKRPAWETLKLVRKKYLELTDENK